MTFEEFFKKKKISVDALQIAEPGLFSEFKRHFEQMGEKSFDHTKKYWFNKLRLLYPAPVEEKVEKVKIDNPLAEQTITESLEEANAKPKPGFTPKFRAAAAAPKPEPENPVEEKKEETPLVPAQSAPKPGFTPRFKAANLPKPEDKAVEEKPAETPPVTEPTALADAPKPAYKPRFNPKNLPNKEE